MALERHTVLEAATEQQPDYILEHVQNSVLNYGMPPLARFTAHKFSTGLYSGTNLFGH